MYTDAMQDPIARRWQQWRLANSGYPLARDAELRKLFSLLSPRSGERIWEAGTGNGNLSLPVAEALAPGGELITTDVEPENIAEVARIARDRGLPMRTQLLPLECPLLDVAEYGGAFDAVVSIATLHHFDNRLEGTGERGRIAALETFYQMLRPGGRLALADVLHGSMAQRYFDRIDDPRHAAPHGHPHDFPTKERLLELLAQAGFKEVSFELAEVPWSFASPQEAAAFVHTLHNATVPEEESFRVAQEMLGLTKTGSRFELGWDLFFVSARR